MSYGDRAKIYVSETKTKCTICKKEHGLVLENIEMGEVRPLKFCKECLEKGNY